VTEKRCSAWILLIAILLFAAGLAAWLLASPMQDPAIAESGPRLPASDPPLEPERPDLIGEPRVETPP